MISYEVWHDEYKGDENLNVYWHGLYFVPVDQKPQIISDLQAIRDEHKISYEQDFKFASSLQKPKSCRVIENHLLLFVHSLIVKELEAQTDIRNRDDGKKYKKDFTSFLNLSGLYGCKFILFKIPDNHEALKNEEQSYANRVETTFRHALRSGLHFLCSEDVQISKFYFDGHEHHGRNIDLNRIIKGEMRNHVHLAEDLSIDDTQMSDRDVDTKMIICLVDNIIGGLTASLNSVDDPNSALYPLSGIIDRENQGTLNLNVNGKWYKSISMFEMNISNNNKRFGPISNIGEDVQPSLF
jgi:hypothetical protein